MLLHCRLNLLCARTLLVAYMIIVLLQLCLNKLQPTQGDVKSGDFSPEQKQQQDKKKKRECMGEGRVIETSCEVVLFPGRIMHPVFLLHGRI